MQSTDQRNRKRAQEMLQLLNQHRRVVVEEVMNDLELVPSVESQISSNGHLFSYNEEQEIGNVHL